MRETQQVFAGGLADPVLTSQSVFRILMDCMARPGTIGRLAQPVRPPQPFGKAQGLIALSLCDHDTPVHLSPALARSTVPAWLSFHAGAPIVTERSHARFAFCDASSPFPALSAFAKGTQDYPDRSTTIVADIAALSGGAPLRLTGPGIRTAETIAPVGLPPAFIMLWAENRSLFPRGVDLILTSGDQCLCLPRSVRIANGESA